MTLNILVTAVGSELAFSVIKAIKLMKKQYRLVGCDIYQEVVGKYWCDQFYNVPLAREEEKYIQSLKAIIHENDINIIIPTADIEFFILSKYKQDFKEKLNCHILINDYKEIERFNDKWLAYEWYLKEKLPTPMTFLLDDLMTLKNKLERIKYPIFMKPRVGGGSRTIFTVNSFEDIIKYQPIVPKPILQEYLFPDDEEYTAGTYRTQDNNVLVILLKRTLKFGMTNTAKVVNDPDLEEFCRNVILHTNLTGSNNIQFRVTHNGPKILEINPRFSGTTGIRAHFGFNDVEIWIDEILFNKKIVQPQIKNGRVLRFMEELYRFDS